MAFGRQLLGLGGTPSHVLLFVLLRLLGQLALSIKLLSALRLGFSDALPLLKSFLLLLFD